jgi:hypothetical protein
MTNALLLFTQSFLFGVFLAQNAAAVLHLLRAGADAGLLPAAVLGRRERRRASPYASSSTRCSAVFRCCSAHGLSAGAGGGFNGDFGTSRSTFRADTQIWLFWVLFLAFAIKLPIFPFHSWQPDTYTMAPCARHHGARCGDAEDGLVRHHARSCSRSCRSAWNIGSDTVIVLSVDRGHLRGDHRLPTIRPEAP